MKYLYREKIGCCNKYGEVSIPELKLKLWFSDDCRHQDESSLPPFKEVGQEVPEVFLGLNNGEDYYHDFLWTLDGKPISPNEALEIYLTG